MTNSFVYFSLHHVTLLSCCARIAVAIAVANGHRF